jgi:hypothetical protein
MSGCTPDLVPPCVREVQLEVSMFRNLARNRHSDFLEGNTLGPWA